MCIVNKKNLNFILILLVHTNADIKYDKNMANKLLCMGMLHTRWIMDR